MMGYKKLPKVIDCIQKYQYNIESIALDQFELFPMAQNQNTVNKLNPIVVRFREIINLENLEFSNDEIP